MKPLAILGMCCVLLVPFMVDSDFLFPAVSSKVLLFRAGTCLLLIGMASRVRIDAIGTALLTLLAAGLMSDLLGLNPSISIFSTHERMDGWIQQAYLTAFYFAAVPLMRLPKVHILYQALLCLSVLVTLTAFSPFIWQPWSYRPVSIFGNPTYYGGYALFIIALAMVRFSVPRGALVALCVAALFALSDRGALVGLAIGVAVWLFLMSRFWFSVLLTTVLGALFLASPLVFGTIRRILEHDPDVAQRFYIWGQVLHWLPRSPTWGFGHEGIFTLSHLGLIDPHWDRAHNLFLDWVMDGGVVSLVCHAWIGWLVWRLIRCLPQKEKAAYAAAFAAYLGNGLFAFDTIATAAILYLCMAYLTSRESTVPSR